MACLSLCPGSTWLLLGNILHFCLLWFSGGNPHVTGKNHVCCSPSNVKQVKLPQSSTLRCPLLGLRLEGPEVVDRIGRGFHPPLSGRSNPSAWELGYNKPPVSSKTWLKGLKNVPPNQIGTCVKRLKARVSKHAGHGGGSF